MPNALKKTLSKFRRNVTKEMIFRQWIPPAIPRLMIETTDHCNLECPFCSNKDIERRKFQMPPDLFEKIIDDYAAMGGKMVRLYSTGEPLMCTKFFPFIEYCNAKGMSVSFTTNGLLFNEDKIRRTLALKIDHINFSIEGLDKEGYEKIRIGGKFETLLQNLILFKRLRDEIGGKHPRLRIQSALQVEEQNEDYIRRFLQVWQSFADGVYFSPVGSQGGTNSSFKEHIPIEDRIRCSFFWDLMTVNNNGTVSCCCVDYNRSKIVGDANKQSLAEIWKNAAYKKWRTAAQALRYEEISEECARCTSVSRSFDQLTHRLNQISEGIRTNVGERVLEEVVL